MKRYLLPCLVIAACTSSPAPDQPLTAMEAPVEQAAVTTSGLVDSKDLGTVTGTDGHSYTVRSGRYCDECDAELSLYIFDAAQGEPNVNDGANARMHPGTARDGETGEPYYEARAFFGEVLQGVPGVVWYERAMGTDGTMEEHTVLVDLTEGVQEQQQPGHGLMERTLALAAAGKCTEIAGVDRTSAP